MHTITRVIFFGEVHIFHVNLIGLGEGAKCTQTPVEALELGAKSPVEAARAILKGVHDLVRVA